jgi:hypothetical protein
MKTTPDALEVIGKAFREFVRRRKLRKILKFQGKMHWEGDLDALRLRRKAQGEQGE